MKITSWKHIVAASSACLLLLTVPANAILLPPIHFGKQSVNFDIFPSGNSVSYGYGGLGWDNFYTLDPSTLDRPSGYMMGLISPNNVILNSPSVGVSVPSFVPNAPLAYSVIYGTRYAFMLNSAYLTAAWNDNLKVTVVGYYYGRLIYNPRLYAQRHQAHPG